MALDPAIKKNWVEIQKRHSHPVNAIGVRIDPSDTMTMNVWKSEGLEAYVKKD